MRAIVISPANVDRVHRRRETDARVAAVFAATDEAALTEKLAAAEIAFARVNDPGNLAQHPHLRRMTVDTPSGPVSYPAAPTLLQQQAHGRRRVPSLGEHTERVRAEFRALAAGTACS